MKSYSPRSAASLGMISLTSVFIAASMTSDSRAPQLLRQWFLACISVSYDVLHAISSRSRDSHFSLTSNLRGAHFLHCQSLANIAYACEPVFRGVERCSSPALTNIIILDMSAQWKFRAHHLNSSSLYSILHRMAVSVDLAPYRFARIAKYYFGIRHLSNNSGDHSRHRLRA